MSKRATKNHTATCSRIYANMLRNASIHRNPTSAVRVGSVAARIMALMVVNAAVATTKITLKRTMLDTPF